MKNQDKQYLKVLLLASISSIGIPAAHATGSYGTIARKEREGDDVNFEMVSEMLSNGILESHPSFGQVLGHTSHSSHSSHGSHGSHSSSSHGSHSSHTSSSHTSHTSHTSSSHTSHTSSSHTSHTSSSGYNNGDYGGIAYGGSTHSSSSEEVKGLLIGTGAVVAGVGLYLLIKHIIKTHKKHVTSRKAEINRFHPYASRNLSKGVYGTDVDSMTDLLIENDVLDRFDKTFSHKWSHYKYDRKVKRSVKQMQARMGHKRTGKASETFLISLQQWKNKRKELMKAASKDSLDITRDRNALMAVAILLVEKGYLKSYNVDDIMNEHEKSKIVRAYYAFLRDHRLPETSLIDEQKLNLLNYSPNKQK